MLNVKKLSELLARNVHPSLYPRMFVMSPNGTLLAYSRPVDIKELRDQAALVSMAWKDHEANLAQKREQNSPKDESSEVDPSGPFLETLTIEFENNNLIVRAIQKNLLLVLVGGVPPGSGPRFKMTPESSGDERYPSVEPRLGLFKEAQHDEPSQTGHPPQSTGSDTFENPPGSPPQSSHMSLREKDMKVGVLHIQRKKIDAITRFLRSDFDSRGFVMPDDGVFP